MRAPSALRSGLWSMAFGARPQRRVYHAYTEAATAERGEVQCLERQHFTRQ